MEAQAVDPELSSSFAGALAAFASDAATPLPDDGLADDIAVLSYERAVRTQSGFNRADATPADSEANHPEPADTNVDKKSASITIRMSHAECEQLRRRAVAANLTVSAYMRSCILEAETLRAQVKEALAELRAAVSDAPPAAALSADQSPRRWWQPWPQFGARSN